MNEAQLIGAFFFGSFIVGVVLFWGARIFFEQEIKADSSRNVGAKEYCSAATVTTVGVALFYLAFKGVSWAGWIFAAMLFIAPVWGGYRVIQNGRRSGKT